MKQEIQGSAPSGAIYGLGLIEAAVYFISYATGFWMGVVKPQNTLMVINESGSGKW